MTSLWRQILFDFLENVNLSSSDDGLLPHQIWFNLDKGKQSYGGGGVGEAESAPQVENVLNRPGEIGLRVYLRCYFFWACTVPLIWRFKLLLKHDIHIISLTYLEDTYWNCRSIGKGQKNIRFLLFKQILKSPKVW